MLNFIKRQGVGTWIALGTLILTVISFIIYGKNVSGGGYFHNASVSEVVTFSVLEIVFLVLIIVVPQFQYKGIAEKVVNIVLDVLRILAAVFLVLALLNFISARVEGLAYIYFSNPDILETIQAPETGNLASAQSAIAGFVLYGITWLAAMVGAFFTVGRKKA